MAHDIRTPLSSVLMWVRLLRSGDVETDAGLAAVEESARQLGMVLDGIFAIAAEAPTPVAELGALLAAAVSDVAKSPGAPPILIEPPAPDDRRSARDREVAGDPARAAEALRALVALGASVCPRDATLVIVLSCRASSAYVEVHARRGERESGLLIAASLPLISKPKGSSRARPRGAPR